MNQPMSTEAATPDRAADFSAPLAGTSAGRLEFRRGASRLNIRSQAPMEELFRAHFEGPVPEVDVTGGTVAVRYRHLSPGEWARQALLMGDHGADIVLNSGIPWELELRGGVSRLDADLGSLDLHGLDIKGGASHVELVLGQPSGIVPIHVRGGISHVTLWRPAGVAIRASVRGGISKLALDDQRFGAIGGETRVTTGGWLQATVGYDLDIAGGASDLTVTAQ